MTVFKLRCKTLEYYNFNLLKLKVHIEMKINSFNGYAKKLYDMIY